MVKERSPSAQIRRSLPPAVHCRDVKLEQEEFDSRARDQIDYYHRRHDRAGFTREAIETQIYDDFTGRYANYRHLRTSPMTPPFTMRRRVNDERVETGCARRFQIQQAVRQERVRSTMTNDNNKLMQENMRLRTQLQERQDDEEMNAIMNQRY